MKSLLLVLSIVVSVWSLTSAQNKETVVESSKLSSIPFNTITGEATSLAAYSGKVVLIVNVASKCGFTPQYEGLEKLYLQYKDSGLVILGFPANNFLSQEPGSDQEILTFCTTKYNVTFPMMSKISVKGKDQHPLYTYLTKESSCKGAISWNFNKFLLDRQGNVIARFDSKTKPDDPELVAKIKELLAK
jgi:glutathione peroxidase-family protein